MSDILNDRELLAELLENKSISDIGRELGVHHMKVYHAAKRAGLLEQKKPAKTEKHAEPEKKPDQDDEGMTLKEFILKSRPRLKFVLDDDDDRPMMQQRIGSETGSELAQMVEEGCKLDLIRKKWMLMRRRARNAAAHS